LNGPPDEDQRAITAIVGKPVKFCGYDETGKAELELVDQFDDSSHTIWVAPEFIDGIAVHDRRRDSDTIDGRPRPTRSHHAAGSALITRRAPPVRPSPVNHVEKDSVTCQL
jgi:hypothetical protein